MSDELNRAAPIAAQLDANGKAIALPPLSKERIIELAEAWGMTKCGYENDPRGHCIDFARAIESAIADEYAERIRLLEREKAGAYEAGRNQGQHDQDVTMVTLRDENIRLLKLAEHAQQPTQRTDSPKFRKLIAHVQGFDDGEPIFGESESRLIAYIDGRTAGTAPEGMPVAQEPKYGIRAGQLYNRASGAPIPTDEPVFIFRARDAHAVNVLAGYAREVLNADHAKAVWGRVEDFKRFWDANPERMKQPDTAAPSLSGTESVK